MKSIKPSIALVIVTLLFTGCGKTPEQAREKIAKMGMVFPDDFQKCVANNDTIGVQLFLQANVNPNQIMNNYEGGDKTPLMIAAEKGNIVMIKALLQSGASPYAQGRIATGMPGEVKAFTAVEIARGNNHPEAAELIRAAQERLTASLGGAPGVYLEAAGNYTNYWVLSKDGRVEQFADATLDKRDFQGFYSVQDKVATCRFDVDGGLKYKFTITADGLAGETSTLKRLNEEAVWKSANSELAAIGTNYESAVVAFTAYLNQFPEGAHTAEAKALVSTTLPEKIQTRDYQRHKAEAAQLVANRDYAKANAALASATRNSPEGSADSELKALQERIKQGEAYATAFADARKQFEQKNWDEALAAIDQALLLSPQDKGASALKDEIEAARLKEKRDKINSLPILNLQKVMSDCWHKDRFYAQDYFTQNHYVKKMVRYQGTIDSITEDLTVNFTPQKFTKTDDEGEVNTDVRLRVVLAGDESDEPKIAAFGPLTKGMRIEVVVTLDLFDPPYHVGTPERNHDDYIIEGTGFIKSVDKK